MSDRGDNLSIDLALTLPSLDLRVRQDIPLAGVTAVFGPSGAGKSTLLRMIAGLETRAKGRIGVPGAVWQDDTGLFARPENRSIGYVFQDARLFEHLSVPDNLSFGRKRRPGGRIAPADVEAALDLGPLLDQPVASLSGGQRQRVALGRALLSNPQILLLDEPMAALDVPARHSVMGYLERVFEEFALPAILVSHNPDEVRRLADRVVLLDRGLVTASGPVDKILQDAVETDVTPGSDAGSVLVAHLKDELPIYGVYRLDLRGQPMTLPVDRPRGNGQDVRLSVRARDVALALERPAKTSVQNILEGSVCGIGGGDDPFVLVSVRIGEQTLLSRITRLSCDQLQLKIGDRVFCLIKSASMPLSG